jgi:hypothetical protein
MVVICKDAKAAQLQARSNSCKARMTRGLQDVLLSDGLTKRKNRVRDLQSPKHTAKNVDLKQTFIPEQTINSL